MIATLSIIGALIALGAYLYVTYYAKRVDKTYHVVNLIACFVLGYVAIATRTPGYLLLNAVWGCIAVKELVTFKGVRFS